MTLALWARQADIDPVRLYERIAPVLVAPLSLSAQLALGWALFARPRAARVCAVCATLVLLSAGPLPVPARILEDRQLHRLIVLDDEDNACGIFSLSDIAVKAHLEHLTWEVLERISEPASPRR